MGKAKGDDHLEILAPGPVVRSNCNATLPTLLGRHCFPPLATMATHLVTDVSADTGELLNKETCWNRPWAGLA